MSFQKPVIPERFLVRLNILSLSLACSLDSSRRDRTQHTGLEGADLGSLPVC